MTLGVRKLWLFFWILLALGSFFAPLPEARSPAWTDWSEPTALTAAEEASPAAMNVAKRFNPAMAFPARDIWPTSVSYSWHDAAWLMGRVVEGTGKVIREFAAHAGTALNQKAWDGLPDRDLGGNRIEYFINAPGDDHTNSSGSWRNRWQSIMTEAPGAGDITTSTYPPTQYAHVFWYNRERGLLGIQYWFYYPFDQWINRHEGDWEHINVILQGPSTFTSAADYKPVGYQYFFHGQAFEPKTVLLDPRGGEHALVFAGGRGSYLFWSGVYSGGSYPWPAVFSNAGGWGPFQASDDTRQPQRLISAARFKVVLLPEPERLDTGKHPELSWLRLPFFAGQDGDASNPMFLAWMGAGKPPLQPGRRADWNAKRPSRTWPGSRQAAPEPNGWARLKLPPPGSFKTKLAGN